MHTLEAPRRFSESLFWRLMLEYYEQRGAEAWSSGEVPFRVTSNPYIARAYARIILGYLRDIAAGANGPIDAGKPVTILELGAGLGRFSFLLALALADVVAACGDRIPRLQFLMTDASKANVSAWMANPKLASLVKSGAIELALLDVASPAWAELMSGRRLADAIGGQPVVVIANYLLDVLIHDAFRVERGVMQELRIGLELDKKPAKVIGSKEVFEALRFRQEPATINWPYYPEPRIDAVLAAYGHALTSATFLFPISGLRFLEAVREMSGGRVLLLVSDKARISSGQMEGSNSLSLAVTGSFSTTVNLDAYARWTRSVGGAVMQPPDPNQHFDTYAFLAGQVAPCRELELAFADHVSHFSPADHSALARDVRSRASNLKPAALLALMKLGGYDPQMLVHLEEALAGAAAHASAHERAGLVIALDKVWENHFPVAGAGHGHDVAFVLGRVFRRLGQPERALDLYRCSLEERGPHSSTLRNIGRCLEDLGRHDEALQHYHQAVALRPDALAEEGIARLERRKALHTTGVIGRMKQRMAARGR